MQFRNPRSIGLPWIFFYTYFVYIYIYITQKCQSWNESIRCVKIVECTYSSGVMGHMTCTSRVVQKTVTTLEQPMIAPRVMRACHTLEGRDWSRVQVYEPLGGTYPSEESGLILLNRGTEITPSGVCGAYLVPREYFRKCHSRGAMDNVLRSNEGMIYTIDGQDRSRVYTLMPRKPSPDTWLVCRGKVYMWVKMTIIADHTVQLGLPCLEPFSSKCRVYKALHDVWNQPPLTHVWQLYIVR